MLLTKKSSSGQYVPFFSIELKVFTQERLGRNPLDFVAECLTYAKYLLKCHDLKAITCSLSNGETWHLFHYDGIQITKYWNIRLPPEASSKENFEKLYQLVSIAVYSSY